jgi:hypothetical protein
MTHLHASEAVRDGFENDTFVPVTESPPRTLHSAEVVVMVAVPHDFVLMCHRVVTNTQGVQEYFVPAEVLNQFQRAIFLRS